MSDTVSSTSREETPMTAPAKLVTTPFEAVDGSGRRYVMYAETTLLAPFATSTRYYTQDGRQAWSIDDDTFELFEPGAGGSSPSVRVTRLGQSA